MLVVSLLKIFLINLKMTTEVEQIKDYFWQNYADHDNKILKFITEKIIIDYRANINNNLTIEQEPQIIYDSNEHLYHIEVIYPSYEIIMENDNIFYELMIKMWFNKHKTFLSVVSQKQRRLNHIGGRFFFYKGFILSKDVIDYIINNAIFNYLPLNQRH